MRALVSLAAGICLLAVLGMAAADEQPQPPAGKRERPGRPNLRPGEIVTPPALDYSVV
jgi:hypothetical protein